MKSIKEKFNKHYETQYKKTIYGTPYGKYYSDIPPHNDLINMSRFIKKLNSFERFFFIKKVLSLAAKKALLYEINKQKV